MESKRKTGAVIQVALLLAFHSRSRSLVSECTDSWARLLLSVVLVILWPLQTAYAGETKIFSFTNHSGHQASGLHINFRGNAADAVVNPFTIEGPTQCGRGTASSSGNSVDIVWQSQGCMESNSTVSFTVTTNGPDPLEFGEGYWTGPAGARMANVLSGDVAVTSSPTYRLVAPDLAQEGEQFTGMVVEETPTGNIPVTQSDKVVFNGQVVPQEPGDGSRFRFPPFEKKLGNYFIGVIVVPRTLTSPRSHQISLPAYTQHIEILPRGTSNQVNKPQIARSSSVVAPGAPLRVEGQNLQLLKRAALVDEQSHEIPLGNSAGSSLQRIYLPSNDLPISSSSTYRYIGWDAAGNRYESPNISRRAHLQLNGPPIKTRGQQGEFTITSDTPGMIELSGGEPIISVAEHRFTVEANQPRKVKFTAQEVGQYTLNIRLYNPEDLPPSARAPKVDCKPGTLTAHYDPRTNQTVVDAPVTLTNSSGGPVVGVSLDMALSSANGVEYARLTTDNLGRATLRHTFAGNVPLNALSTHVYRVLDYNWKEPSLIDGHPPTIAGPATIAGLFKCAHDCQAGQKKECFASDIKITGMNDFDLEETHKQLELLEHLDELATMIELPQGAITAPLGGLTIDETKSLVEKIKQRNDLWKKQGPVKITLVMEYEECVIDTCWWPISTDLQEVWKTKTKEYTVSPPFHGGANATGGADTWAPGTFDLKHDIVRQALKDAYEKAKESCPGP